MKKNTLLITFFCTFLIFFVLVGYFAKDALAYCNVAYGNPICETGSWLDCNIYGKDKVTHYPVGWDQCGCTGEYRYCNWFEVSIGDTCSCGGGGDGGGGSGDTPQCGAAPLVMIDKSDDASGFAWWGTSLQVIEGTQVCYMSSPSGNHYTSRQTQDGTGYKGGVNVGGVACFTLALGNSWTTGEIEAYENECDGAPDGTCEQLYYSESCVNRTDIVPVAAPPSPWWQTKDADIMTNGNISSKIPSSCTLPGCNPLFDLDGTGGFPGVVAYGGTSFDFNKASGNGANQVSSKNWLANASYLGKTYGYAYFSRLGPKVDCADDATKLCFNSIITPSINGGDLNSGGVAKRGYVWYKRAGDLAINGNVNLVGDRKVVLLVEGGDLIITGRINLQEAGVGFFMTIVGKDVNGQKGNILVDPSVTHPTQPGLEGIFLTDGLFTTGAGSNKLWVKGSVVAYGGVLFQRDLGNGNSAAPAELFEYNPTLLFTFPRELTRKNMTWKEVAP